MKKIRKSKPRVAVAKKTNRKATDRRKVTRTKSPKQISKKSSAPVRKTLIKRKISRPTAEALVRRLLALVPPPKLHLTSFHGVYAPHAALRPLVTQPPTQETQLSTVALRKAKTKQKTKRRLDWATLHRRTFGTDVLACPCGGRRTIRALHSTRKQAEQRLADLGITVPPWRLPPATAPPQLNLAV